MDRLTPRVVNGAGFLACVGMMAYALYAEYVLFLMPCPLCSFQRVGIVLLGIVFLVAFLHGPKAGGRRVYAALLGVAAAGASGVAGYHVWMQNLPKDEVPACGPGLSYMMETLPLFDVIKQVFTGSGSCADIDWQFLGLSMPAWVLILALALGVAGVWNNLRRASEDAARESAIQSA